LTFYLEDTVKRGTKWLHKPIENAQHNKVQQKKANSTSDSSKNTYKPQVMEKYVQEWNAWV
jgi:hypothetical protein